MADKDRFRLELADKTDAILPPSNTWGRIAEKVRRLPAYRPAKQVFVDPAPSLKQICLNTLMDGKKLVMPSPALKDGFYLLSANAVPFNRRIQAISSKGLVEFGHKLSLTDCRDLEISFLVTSCPAWDKQGNRLGEGQGFFDLSFAILSELQAVGPQAVVAGVAGQGQKVTSVPVDPWDVGLDFVVCEDEIIEFPFRERKIGSIFWDKLEPRRIKKISPLFQLRAHSQISCNSSVRPEKLP